MRVGVNLPNYSDLGTRHAVSAIADAAEGLGFASLWVTDHVLVPTRLRQPYGQLLESLTMLSYLAARTSRIGLGTSVLILPQRDPLLVAKQAATIHHLSDGRLTLGVGVGWIEEEYRFLRADFHRRGRIADEYIEAVRELLNADQPSFHGQSVSYDDVVFSPKPATPLPIVVGGSSQAALTRAATLGDGWHGIHQSPDDVRSIAQILHSKSVRPDFKISLRTSMRIGQGIEGAKPDTTITGDIDAIRRTAQTFAAAGVNELVIDIVADGLDDLIEQLTSFARDVMPDIEEHPQN